MKKKSKQKINQGLLNRLFQSSLALFLLAFVISFIAYGQTLQMHFWKDDNALMYKVQRPLEAIGFFGKGITGEGPYRHISDQLLPFYPFFGMNPTGYFFVGILLYFLSAIGVFYLAKELSGEKKIALLSMLIYSAGYIGSESLFGIINSWQTSRGILTATLAFAFFLKYLKNNRLRYYFISLGLFFVTIDTGFIRSHGLFLALIGLDLLFAKFSKDFKSFFNFIFRQVPFQLVNYSVYFANPVTEFGSKNFLQDFLNYKKFYIITTPLQNLGNLFVPSFFTDKVSSLYPMSMHLLPEFSWSAVISGLLFITVTLFLYIKLHFRYKVISKVLLFSFIWAWAGIFAYNARETNLILYSTHRYLSYSFAGVAIFFSTLIIFIDSKFLRKSNVWLALPALFIILVYLVLGNLYQREFNVTRSLPTKKFFSQLQSQIKKINKGDMIYIDTANHPIIKSRYNAFYGAGMLPDSAAIALFYNINYDDFNLVTNSDELFSKIKLEKDLARVRTFYFDGNDLIDTTDEFSRLSLNSPALTIPLENMRANNNYIITDVFSTSTNFMAENGQVIGISPEVYIKADISSVVPIKLSFDMQLEPLYPQLPFRANSGSIPEIENKVLYFDYLNYLQEFRKNITIKSKTVWRDNNVRNLVDGRNDTVWWGDRGYWDSYFRNFVEDPEYLLLDLKKIDQVSGITYITNRLQTTPVDYKILVSKDAKEWELVLSIQRHPVNNKSRIVDLFSPINTRFIKIEFYRTVMNDSPDMSEIGVIPTGYEKLNFEILDVLEKNPFSQINNQEELRTATNYASRNGKIKLFWRADNDDAQDLWKFREIPVTSGNQFHTYGVEIPAGGRKFIGFTLQEVNFPVVLKLKNIHLDYVLPFKP